VIVALRLERHGEAVAEVEDARVLAGALQDPWAAARQTSEQQRRVLVAAVLGPEQREDSKLEVVRLALQQLLDPVVLPVREPELTVDRLFGDGAQEVILAVPPEVTDSRVYPVQCPREASTVPR
jgi:hypothetical protein